MWSNNVLAARACFDIYGCLDEALFSCLNGVSYVMWPDFVKKLLLGRDENFWRVFFENKA